MIDYDLEGKATWIQCEGIDTVAEILLPLVCVVMRSVNSVSVAQVDNQHRIYWIDVSKQVHRGQNSIVIAFANPAAYSCTFIPNLQMGQRKARRVPLRSE